MEAAHRRGATIKDNLTTSGAAETKLSLPRLRLAHFQKEVGEYMQQNPQISTQTSTRLPGGGFGDLLDGGRDRPSKNHLDQAGSKTTRRVMFTDATARAEGGAQTERVMGTTKRFGSRRLSLLSKPNTHGISQRPPTSKRDVLPGEGNLRMSKYLRPTRRKTPTTERSPGERVGHAGGPQQGDPCSSVEACHSEECREACISPRSAAGLPLDTPTPVHITAEVLHRDIKRAGLAPAKALARHRSVGTHPRASGTRCSGLVAVSWCSID